MWSDIVDYNNCSTCNKLKNIKDVHCNEYKVKPTEACIKHSVKQKQFSESVLVRAKRDANIKYLKGLKNE